MRTCARREIGRKQEVLALCKREPWPLVAFVAFVAWPHTSTADIAALPYALTDLISTLKLPTCSPTLSPTLLSWCSSPARGKFFSHFLSTEPRNLHTKSVHGTE